MNLFEIIKNQPLKEMAKHINHIINTATDDLSIDNGVNIDTFDFNTHMTSKIEHILMGEVDFSGTNLDSIIKDDPTIIKKSFFIEHFLSPTLEACECGWRKCQYLVKPDGEEYVIITDNNGYTKRICISADSKEAIVRDVFNNL